MNSIKNILLIIVINFIFSCNTDDSANVIFTYTVLNEEYDLSGLEGVTYNNKEKRYGMVFNDNHYEIRDDDFELIESGEFPAGQYQRITILNGSIYAAYQTLDNNLVRFRHRKFIKTNLITGESKTLYSGSSIAPRFLETEEYYVISGHDEPCLLINKSTFEEVNFKEEFSSNRIAPISLGKDNSGNILIGSSDGELWIYDYKKWEVLFENDEFGQINGIYTDSRDYLWMSGSRHISVWDPFQQKIIQSFRFTESAAFFEHANGDIIIWFINRDFEHRLYIVHVP